MSDYRNAPPDEGAPGWGGDEGKNVLEYASQHGSVPRGVIATLWPLLRLQSGPGKDRADAFVADYSRGLKTDADAERLADNARRLVWSQGMSLNDSLVAAFTPTQASIDEQFRPRSHFGSASSSTGDGPKAEPTATATARTRLPGLQPTSADLGMAVERGDGRNDIDLAQRGDGVRVVEPRREYLTGRGIVSARRGYDL